MASDGSLRRRILSRAVTVEREQRANEEDEAKWDLLKLETHPRSPLDAASTDSYRVSNGIEERDNQLVAVPERSEAVCPSKAPFSHALLLPLLSLAGDNAADRNHRPDR